MKKILFIFLGGALISLAACNSGDEKTNESTTTEKTTTTPPATTTEKKTEVSVSPGGAEVKTKDVNVKVNTKDTTHKK